MTQPAIRQLALAAILALSAAAPTVAAEVAFEGSGYLTGLSASCGSATRLEGGLVRAVYLPAGLGDNGETARLSFFDRVYAQGYEGEGPFGRNWTPAAGGEIGAAPRLYAVRPRVRILQQVPRDVADDTPGLRIRGLIRNFSGLDGCEAAFDFHLLRRLW